MHWGPRFLHWGTEAFQEGNSSAGIVPISGPCCPPLLQARSHPWSFPWLFRRDPHPGPRSQGPDSEAETLSLESNWILASPFQILGPCLSLRDSGPTYVFKSLPLKPNPRCSTWGLSPNFLFQKLSDHLCCRRPVPHLSLQCLHALHSGTECATTLPATESLVFFPPTSIPTEAELLFCFYLLPEWPGSQLP
jgi:hypothetical protein